MWIEKGGGRCPPEGYEIVIENASTSKIKKRFLLPTPLKAVYPLWAQITVVLIFSMLISQTCFILFVFKNSLSS